MGEAESAIDRAVRLKAAGNAAFSAGDCALAVSTYGSALSALSEATSLVEESESLSMTSGVARHEGGSGIAVRGAEQSGGVLLEAG